MYGGWSLPYFMIPLYHILPRLSIPFENLFRLTLFLPSRKLDELSSNCPKRKEKSGIFPSIHCRHYLFVGFGINQYDAIAYAIVQALTPHTVIAGEGVSQGNCVAVAGADTNFASGVVNNGKGKSVFRIGKRGVSHSMYPFSGWSLPLFYGTIIPHFALFVKSFL